MRRDDERHDEHAREDQQQRGAGWSLDHSLGEKLMCRRGLLGAQLEPVKGAGTARTAAGDVDAEGQHRQAHPQADADRIGELASPHLSKALP